MQYLVKCLNCGYTFNDIKKVTMLYGAKIFSSDLLVGDLVTKKRKLANILNERNIECPQCREKGQWSWI